VFTFIFVLLFGSIAVLLGGPRLGLLSESLIILPAVVYVVITRRPFLRTFRIAPISTVLAGQTVLITLCTFVLGDALDRLIHRFFPMPEEWMEALVNLMTIDSFGDAVLLFSSAVLMAGIAEEMLFRGLIQRTLEHYRDPAMGIVLSSVFFALVHFNPWTAIQITLLGLVLGYLTWRTGSIVPAVILHSVNNLLSIALLNIPEQRLSWYGSENHVHWHWIAVALLVFIVTVRAFNRRSSELLD
jgi:membrane protease YdiL (CAAX protease family)